MYIWCFSDGFPSFRELAWSTDCLLVGLWYKLFSFFRGFLLWFQMAMEYSWHVLKGNYAELGHSQDSKCFSEDFCCDFKWLWNKPDASHQIGVVETLIKSVRKGLHASCKLKNRTFTEEQWRTFLSETTFIINGRPLYLSSNNIWESPPITPNDILMGHHLQTPSTRIRRKGQPQTSSKKYPRSSEWILEMLDEVLRTKSVTAKQVAPNQGKCWSWRFSFGVRPQSEKITMEAGSCRHHVSGKRWPGQKGENQDPGWWIWQTNPQVVSHSNQRGTEYLIKPGQRSNEH